MTINENGECVIPSSVKRPYTGSRSNGDAIYTSIVKGTLKGFEDMSIGLECDIALFDGKHPSGDYDYDAAER